MKFFLFCPQTIHFLEGKSFLGIAEHYARGNPGFAC